MAMGELNASAADAESAVFSILVVCTANICRSPLAEHLLRTRLANAAGGTKFKVSSAGVRGWDSTPMDAPAAAELRRLGGDASSFRSRPLSTAQCEKADLILTATTEHRAAVLELAPRALKRTFTLVEFAHLVTQVATVADAAGSPTEVVRRAAAARGAALLDNYDVPDPYGGSPHLHRSVADVVETAITEVASVLAPTAAASAEIRQSRR